MNEPSAEFEIDTLAALPKTLDVLRGVLTMLLANGPLRISVSPLSHKRAAGQNSLKDIWYREIEKQGREMSTRDARRLCKLTIGVPILRGGKTPECVKFRAFWDGAIKKRLTYEEKLEAMDYVPVTSLMKEDQMRDYLTTMQETFAAKGIKLAGLERGQEQYPEAAA